MTCWLCGFETTKLASNVADAPLCKNGPCQICMAVEKVDEEINQTVATLRLLLVKRCDLRSEQNRVHGTLIHQLPVELKSYIFQLLLPSRNKWGKIHESERISSPSYLASICRSWRDIAWSNPFLWSTIHIKARKGISTSDAASRINFIHDCIRRSQTLPLTVHFSVFRDSEHSDEELKGEIDALSQCSNRWHSLSLNMPSEMLHTFRRNLHYIPLKKLRINASEGYKNSKPFGFLNPKVSPETIEVSGVSFRSLQISWNCLSTAIVDSFNLGDITQLFQSASQMTCCHILHTLPGPANFSIPPILHQRLKTLIFRSLHCRDSATRIIGALNLPSLEEFHTNDSLLTSACLPSLVLRSSCPLTRMTLLNGFGYGPHFNHDQRLPGVTDLVVETREGYQARTIAKLLREDCFPDLRHLTLRLNTFSSLWYEGMIPLLLERKRPRPGRPNAGILDQFLVVDRVRSQADFDRFWNSQAGEELKSLNISLREDGFEFL